MGNRVELAREAMRSALQLRRSLAIAREEPVNVYDVATSIGVEVRFVDGPSLEGMFVRDPHPTVCLPSLKHRPRGRVTFSCAHELGHFELDHGTQVDEYLEADVEMKPRPDEELAADTFASSLLMPRQAVVQRFQVRDVQLLEAKPLELFAIAGELDVGYGTLVRHLRHGLELISAEWLKDRLRTTPKEIKASILGATDSHRVILIDHHWPQLPIDLEVGDFVALPASLSVSLPSVLAVNSSHADRCILRAVKPGLGRLGVGETTISVRVARFGYCGLLNYRYLDDPEAE